MCTGSPRKSGTCCEPSGGLGARNPLGQPLGPPGAHFLDGERAQRHFSATRKANSKTVNTGDLEVVAAVSWPHTLHFVAHTQSPGAYIFRIDGYTASLLFFCNLTLSGKFHDCVYVTDIKSMHASHTLVHSCMHRPSDLMMLMMMMMTMISDDRG